MNISNLAAIALLLLSGNLAMAAKPKTTTPVKIRSNQLSEEPFRYNGVVLTGLGHGSGFCAWNSRTFFSAAHVVYQGGQWGKPPIWYPSANSAVLDEKTAIPSRGYYRWADYATLSDLNEAAQTEFGRDVILAFAFEKLIKGKAAPLNLNGLVDLQKSKKTLITGYPADNLYIDSNIEGYFLHKTGPVITPYERFAGNALATTLVTTGHGNSGGPIWTRNTDSKWIASGVLVGGRPSESVVYAFSKDTNSLLQAVAPVILPDIGLPVRVGQVGSYSTFFPYNQRTKIPDGRHEWTSFRIPVSTFPVGSTVKSVSLSLKIRTPHRGDLFIILEGPQGLQTSIPQAAIHNEEGAGANNLVISNRDVSDAFTGIDAKGNWYLRVQDRLAGDIATLKSILLEITTEDVITPPTP